MRSKNQNNQRSNNYYFLILIILIGFIVRLLTYPQVFESNKIVFLETDPYYHMWRVFSYIGTFPKTFLFDPYINYPYGALVGWPPFFDQSIALISLIIGLGNPSTHLVESTGAFMPVLLGILSITATYYIARAIFNERVAIFSSLLLAVMPAHSEISFLGFTDHHIAEVFLSVLAYLFFIRSLKDGSYWFAVLSGIAIGVSFLTWIGAPIFIGILLIYTIIQFIFDKKYGSESDNLTRTGTSSFLTAFFIILIFYIWVPWQKSIAFATLSYFQLIYVGTSAILVFLLGSVSKLMKNQKWYYFPFLILILMASSILLFIIAVPYFYDSLLNGIGYLLRDMPVLRQISEAQPLFYTFDGKFLGWQVFNNPVWYSFAFSFYTGIIGLGWLLYSNRNRIDKDKLFFLIWTLVVLALAFSQRRFTYTLAINVAILSGFFIDKIKTIFFKPYYIVVVLVLIIPNISSAYDMSKLPPKPSDDWYNSLIWLKENTPYPKLGEQYGIMTWWDYGNWILYISKRPVVANNFQIGGDEAARFFVASNEKLANTIMEKRKARYVIVDRRMGLNKFSQDNQLVISGTFMAVASFADKDFGVYLDKNNLPNKNYFDTMYARLHVFDGNGLKNYRMIYESDEAHFDLFDRPTKNIKFFEYVKGAKITGNTSHGEIVSISGTVVTNQKRRFYYNQTTKADENGYFEFTVPYSSDSPYETRLSKSIELKYNNTSKSVNLLENDVLEGNTIRVN